MAQIVGIGIATLDVINVTDGFPAEDSETRAIAQRITRGGNASNTLVVLSQSGHQCTWGGTLGDDAAAEQIIQELQSYRIDTRSVRTVPGSTSPTSYITLNQHTGSRTIVHYRDLPEYRCDDFKKIALDTTDWLHFEGRNIEEVRNMIQHAKTRRPSLPVSVEIEKPRPGIETLFDDADVLLFSKQFALSRGFASAESFLAAQHKNLTLSGNVPLMVCTWGDAGAWALENTRMFFATAVKQSCIVDTIGAGDTFNAGFIHAWQQHHQTQTALDHACQLAGKKCSQSGFNGLTDAATDTQLDSAAQS